MRQEYLCCRQEYLFLDFLLLDIHAFFHNLGHHVPSVNLHFESSTEWLLWMIGSKYSEKVVQDTLKKVICQLAYSFDKWACSCYAILHAIGCAKITRFTTFHWLSVLSDFLTYYWQFPPGHCFHSSKMLKGEISLTFCFAAIKVHFFLHSFSSFSKSPNFHPTALQILSKPITLNPILNLNPYEETLTKRP